MTSVQVRVPEADQQRRGSGSVQHTPPKRNWLLVAFGVTAAIAAAVYVLLAPSFQRQAALLPIEQNVDSRVSPFWASPMLSAAIDPADLHAFADSIVPAEMARTGATGAGVIVVQNGQVILQQGYGFADREHGVPWDAQQTTFIAKSVSKLFTASAVMQLVEQGQLQLDADVNTYLPGWQIANPHAQPIRVRDLLTHTTGIEDRALGSMVARPEEVTPLGTYLRTRLLTPINPAGARISYSDHNTTLAGYLVELRSGMPFADYMQQHVLDPIGMTSSSFAQPRPTELAGRLAVGYLMRDGQGQRIYPDVPPSYNVAPAVALTTTGSDIAQFMIAHLESGQTAQGRLLGDAAITEMHQQQYTSAPGLPGIALGFFEQALRGRRALTHSGGGHGWGHLLVLLPDEHTGVFVAGNLSDDIRVGEVFTTKFVERYFPTAPAAPQLQALPVGAVNLQAYAGTYRAYRYDRFAVDKISHVNEIEVQPNADGTLSPAADPTQQFAPISTTLFQRVGATERIAFRLNADGEAAQLLTNDAVYDRVAWYEPLPVQLLLLLGTIAVLVSAPVAGVIGVVRRSAPGPTVVPMAVWARRLAVAVALIDVLFVVVLGSVIAFAADDFGPLARALNLAYANSPGLFVPIAVAWLGAAATAPVVFFAAWSWLARPWSWVGRVHYALVALAAATFVWILAYWNFIGGRI